MSIETAAIEWIAHRGIANGVPENSLAAIEAAWSAGAQAVEVDVRVSADGVAYLYHDDKIDRLSVASATFAEIGATVDAAEIPTLQSMLALGVPEGYYLFDLKDTTPASIDAVIDVVEKSGFPEARIAFQSESVQLLERIRARLPGGKFYILAELKRRWPLLRRPRADQLVAALQGHDIDAISIKGRRYIDKPFVDALQSSGMQVLVWTINKPDRASHYIDIGVNGIITDRLVELRRGGGQ